MNRRSIAPTVGRLAPVVAVVLLVAGACTAGTPAPTPATPAPASPDPAATPASSPFMLGDVRDLLVLRLAKPTPDAAFTVVEPGQGRDLFSFPDGVVSHDWRTLVSLAADGASTGVKVTTPEGGDAPARVSVPGSWRLPTIGVDKVAGGLSGDGSTLVLEEAVDVAPVGPTSRTRFAVVSTRGSKDPRVITLDGAFAFDALSPGGQWLYLLEYTPGGGTHYQVRRLEVATGKLQDGAIVDKRNIDEQMNGYALTQAVGKAGWVFTLYRSADGAFVHALDTADGIAFCIDLPGTEADDPATAGSWGLVADPSGQRLYVADPVRRTVSAIDLVDFSILRSGRLASVPGVRLAKLESAQPAGGRVALGADGTTLYVVDTTGVAVVSTADLATTGHLGGSGVFRSVAVGSAGTVYAVDDAGRAVRLGTGPTDTTPIGSGAYASIVAVVPLR
jgi:DNA-binding beta-propeller fold protein YncE